LLGNFRTGLPRDRDTLSSSRFPSNRPSRSIPPYWFAKVPTAVFVAPIDLSASSKTSARHQLPKQRS
jgi:hypothetical protein